jgi:hypothetical protein
MDPRNVPPPSRQLGRSPARLMDANQFYWHLGNRIVHSLLILGLWKEFGEKRHCTHLIPTPPLGGRAVIRFGHAALHAAEGQSAASSATNAKACVGQKLSATGERCRTHRPSWVPHARSKWARHRVAAAGSRARSSTWRARDGFRTPAGRDLVRGQDHDARLCGRLHANPQRPHPHPTNASR